MSMQTCMNKTNKQITATSSPQTTAIHFLSSVQFVTHPALPLSLVIPNLKLNPSIPSLASMRGSLICVVMMPPKMVCLRSSKQLLLYDLLFG